MNAGEGWRLAVLGLRRRPVRTLLTLLGLVVALSSTLLFLSLGEGLKRAFRTELGNVGPDLQVNRPTGGLSLIPVANLPASVVSELEGMKAEFGITRLTPVAAEIKQALNPADSAVYYGLPAAQGIATIFPDVRAAQGRVLEPGDEEQPVAVLGAKAAELLKVGLGGQVPINRRYTARVIGILEPRDTLTDTFTFLPLTSAQRALGTGNQVSFVALSLRDPGQAVAVAARLKERLGDGLEVGTRDDVLKSVGRILRSADVLALGLSVVSLCVGGLAVVNTMLMAVFERTREFGTLRAIGARPEVIRALVMRESVLLSVLGWGGGLLCSFPGVWAVNRYTQGLAGVDAAALTPRLVALALGMSLLLGVLGGWWPSRRAGQVSIVRALGQG